MLVYVLPVLLQVERLEAARQALLQHINKPAGALLPCGMDHTLCVATNCCMTPHVCQWQCIWLLCAFRG
jgi:hypothetical protein